MSPERAPRSTAVMERVPRVGILDVDDSELEKYLPEHLQHQVNILVDLFQDYNPELPDYLRQPDRAFVQMRHYNAAFLYDRNKRAAEVASERYEKEVVERINDLIPMATFFVMCLDGRVKVVHTNGFTAEVAAAIRTPGGLLNEFNREDGELVLDDNSTYAEKLLEAVQQSEFNAQIFDSHWACAARQKEEAATGNHPEDKGLLRDVLIKKEMVQATRRFLDGKDLPNHHTSLIQTTFNPVTGFLYMGLETDEALEFAKNKKKASAIEKGQDPEDAVRFAEYTKEVLQELIEEGKIISTGSMLQDEEIRAVLERNKFDIDRANDYIESAIKFTNGLTDIKASLLSKAQQKVLSIYPELASGDGHSQRELEERAVLLLTNLYNAYLNNENHDEIEYLGMEDKEYENTQNYKFGIHNETGVKVSEGGHPPYAYTTFVVYSEDLPNLPGRVEFASEIVRENRLLGRVKDDSGQYGEDETEAFAKAPVSVVVQEITRNTKKLKIPESEWQQIETVDWHDLPKNWDTMSNSELREYLTGKGISHTLLIEGILRLRKKMARLYDPSQQSADHLKDLYKIAMPILCDVKRKTHAVIPFVKVARGKNGKGESSNNLDLAA